MKTDLVYRLGFRDSPVTIRLKLCEACYLRRLESGASPLDKERLPFPVDCTDCLARDGKVSR